MNFVDIGANVGFYSLLAARLIGDKGCVEAFEPNSENCRLILLSRERNGFKQINLNAVALGRQQGAVYFSPALGSNGSLMPSTVDQLANPQCMVVPSFRLDDMLRNRRVDVIKMDVEGAEPAVLEGAVNLLGQRPIIVTEFQIEMLTRISRVDPLEYLRRMQGLGYGISRLQDPTGDEIPIEDPSHFLSFEVGPISAFHELVFRPL